MRGVLLLCISGLLLSPVLAQEAGRAIAPGSPPAMRCLSQTEGRAARTAYGDGVEEFTAEQQRALREAVNGLQARGPFTAPVDLWNLLVHEQTHVLQRRHAELFSGFYVESLGFRHA